MRYGVSTLSETYPARPEAVPEARTRLVEFAERAGASPEQVEGVRLAVSEAMTNAVVHAYRSEPGAVHVSAAVVSGELWILVADDGCGLEPHPDRPGLGLGLALISQSCDNVTIASRASGGTEVRICFELARTEGHHVRTSRRLRWRDQGRRGGGLTPSVRAA